MYIYMYSIIHACNGRIYDHSHSQYIYIYVYINVSVAICGSSKRKQMCLVTVRGRNELILVEQLAEFVW